MANKRISELAPITAPELNSADLLLLSDISAHESKKLQLIDIRNFILLDGRLTGSLLGTASYAITAATASYIGPHSASYAPTASWALNISTASYALTALSSSYSFSSSYAITASYALTSSVELVYSSAFADYSRTSSYLLFTPGLGNGTASYALTASHIINSQISTSYSSTSSWAWNAITASKAISSLSSNTASLASTSSYLGFSGVPNGTASYALVAGTTLNTIKDYGIFMAITQSVSSSQIDMMSITPTLGGQKETFVEVCGTITVPFTSSSPTNGNIELIVVDRQYGYSQSLDASPVYALAGGAEISGTLKYPFILQGKASLYGLYEVYVTASNGVYIEESRTSRFKISSESDQLSVITAEPLQFTSYPTNAIMLYSSSLNPGNAYQGSASQVIFSGSSDASSLLIPPGTVNILQYTWTLTGLQKLVVDNNTGLTYLGGIPTNCISASAANCSLTELPLLASSSIEYLNVPNNTIVADLSLPPSMSYLDVSNNLYVSLPVSMPAGMKVLKADGIGITYTPTTISDNLISMSFARCLNLTSWLAPTFPTSLQYFDVNNSPLSNIPYIVPAGMVYVNIATCSLSSTAIGNIATGLDTNGLSNGYFAFLNNPGSASAFNIIPTITSLRGKGWTIIS